MKKVLIEELKIYPIKSCQGIALQQMDFVRSGPWLDRQWMIVDEHGKFLTQRQMGQLAQIQTAIEKTNLSMIIAGHKYLIPLNEEPYSEQNSFEKMEVEVWDSKVIAHVGNPILNQALSNFLNRTVRLVRYGSSSLRERKGFETRFADGYPILLMNSQSLLELNRKSGQEIPPDRFRANIIVKSDIGFDEDHWKSLQSQSGFSLQNAGECVRCVMTTKDQKTGIVQGAEPLKTLATFRRNEKGVTFGINMVHSGIGTLTVGEELTVFCI